MQEYKNTLEKMSIKIINKENNSLCKRKSILYKLLFSLKEKIIKKSKNMLTKKHIGVIISKYSREY